MTELELARARFAIAKARHLGFLREYTINNHRNWKPGIDLLKAQRNFADIVNELRVAKAKLTGLEP